jgi:hypothetical protein
MGIALLFIQLRILACNFTLKLLESSVLIRMYVRYHVKISTETSCPDDLEIVLVFSKENMLEVSVSFVGEGGKILPT